MRILTLILCLLSANLFAQRSISDAEYSYTHKLAQKGDTTAQYKLGLYYNDKALNGVSYSDMDENGKYTRNTDPENYYIDAAKWFRIAAEKNHRDAQFWLGIYYSNNCGVPRNRIESLAWFSLAGRTNKQVRKEFYEDGLEKLSYEMVEKIQRRALELEKRIEENISSKKFTQDSLSGIEANQVPSIQEIITIGPQSAFWSISNHIEEYWPAWSVLLLLGFVFMVERFNPANSKAKPSRPIENTAPISQHKYPENKVTYFSCWWKTALVLLLLQGLLGYLNSGTQGMAVMLGRGLLLSPLHALWIAWIWWSIKK
jgi:hypothetical protein